MATRGGLGRLMAVDGEGCSDATTGEHWYTLLLAHDDATYPDAPKGKTTYVEAWDGGLSTRRILHFLCHLRTSGNGQEHRGLTVAYYFNYDVAMWLRDLSDGQREMLWEAGFTLWESPDDGPVYFLRYIPSKIFFVGEWRKEWGDILPDVYHWPGPHRLVYDVSGFEQKSFVRAMEEWGVPLPEEVATMKERRGDFTPEERERITDYCEEECAALCAYVRKLDVVLREEELALSAWHGGGAIASVMLKKHGVAERVRDPRDNPACMDAIMRAYFGGRNEIVQLGHLRDVRDYDVVSAYPAACLYVPDTVHGCWSYFDEGEWMGVLHPYSLVHVRWKMPDGVPFGPLPYRHKGGVYFPTRGEGWYHEVELARAFRYFQGYAHESAGGVWEVLDAWRWLSDDDEPSFPLDWVRDYAERRVRYKTTAPHRATVYKYGLNSLYGKFAQHASDPDKPPPYQCFYAAGFITAWTRAKLLDLAFRGHDGRDVVMFATDGLFCRDKREVIGDAPRLGEFGEEGVVEDGYYIQPGCWFGRDGQRRTRGFRRTTLDYDQVKAAWETEGPYAVVSFPERRFMGIGQCAGTGDWSRYGWWVEDVRSLGFYPDRKFLGVPPGGPMPPDVMPEWYPLRPFDMGREGCSEPFVPGKPRDPEAARAYIKELAERWAAEDQPDIGGEG